MKPRYKRRLFFGAIIAASVTVLALVFVPPFISLNHLKPKIENAILTQTGIPAKINGNVNFSLMGGTTIVAHEVSIADGTVESALFRVPLKNIFSLESATLSGDIFIYGAKFNIHKLSPPKIDNNIEINDSIIRFKAKDYHIVHGELANGLLRGTVRTADYKYEFDSNGDEFHIKNKTNNLNISGHLYSDGSASGILSIDTDDLNDWFDFKEPKIKQRVNLSMNFDWDGNYGFKFTNISGNGFDGNIELFEDGRRNIKINARDLNFDLTFLLNGTSIFYDTTLDLDLYGNLKFADKVWKHLKIDAVGTKSSIKINSIIADDLTISGGMLYASGATNLPINMMYNDTPAYCLFSGNPESWKCSEFRYGDEYGSLSVENDAFEIFIQSNRKMPENHDLPELAKLLGTHGKINFQFSDVGGSLDVNNKNITPAYEFAKNKTLRWIGGDLKFLPDSMMDTIGDFAWGADGMSFRPHSNRWQLLVSGGAFILTGTNAKDWFSKIDLRSINDMNYTASGNFVGDNISNLEIKIAEHLFHGSATGNSITLETDLLNIDSFVNQSFVDNIEEEQFLSQEPVMLPFLANANVSLSADTVINNGNAFSNFVYVLKSGVQTFSITDAQRGNLLASITANGNNKYDIVLQLNKFEISGRLLSQKMPINISDTSITAEAALSTSGKIGYDIWNNLTGTIDLSLDGGTLHGLGIDDFYAQAANITTLSAEYALSAALDGGATQVKKIHIVGNYDGGDFVTTKPFTMSLRHTDATGALQISGGRMFGDISLVMRGTSPTPAPISLRLMPNGVRNYSLSEIMISFDPDFMRDFVTTHVQF